MVYKLRDKRKRNEQLIRYSKENPELTMREIGAVFGLSGQRVHVILSKAKEAADGHNR